jgi:hypothetical protein
VVVVGDLLAGFPVAAAFSAAGNDRWGPVVAKTGDEVTFDDLDSAGVIVINDYNGSSRQLEAFLHSRASAEKVVVFALSCGDETFGESSALLSRLGPLKKKLALKVLPAGSSAAVVLPDTISALWAGFPALTTREAAVYRYAEGLPGTPVLRLDNGAVLATQLVDADGHNWVLWATPLGISEANNLCSRP